MQKNSRRLRALFVLSSLVCFGVSACDRGQIQVVSVPSTYSPEYKDFNKMAHEGKFKTLREMAEKLRASNYVDKERSKLIYELLAETSSLEAMSEALSVYLVMPANERTWLIAARAV